MRLEGASEAKNINPFALSVLLSFQERRLA